MAHTYASLFKLACTGLRFFTVYGPWGGPDMALFLFTRAILEGKPIEVFNYGVRCRGTSLTLTTSSKEWFGFWTRFRSPIRNGTAGSRDSASSYAPYRIYNIGNNHPVELLHFIEVLEQCLGKKAQKNLISIQPGDVPATYADVEDLRNDVGFKPDTPIEKGIQNFVDWYREYYQV